MSRQNIASHNKVGGQRGKLCRDIFFNVEIKPPTGLIFGDPQF